MKLLALAFLAASSVCVSNPIPAVDAGGVCVEVPDFREWECIALCGHAACPGANRDDCHRECELSVRGAAYCPGGDL